MLLPDIQVICIMFIMFAVSHVLLYFPWSAQVLLSATIPILWGKKKRRKKKKFAVEMEL